MRIRVQRLLEVQRGNHWDRVGDRSQQWLNLRFVVGLLVRLGAEQGAVELHAHLVAAGKPPPLDPATLARLLDGPGGPRYRGAARRGTDVTSAVAVSPARSCLRTTGR